MQRFRIIMFALFALMALPATAETKKIVAFGDSLTAGFGLEQGLGFVPKLEAALRANGYDVTVVNAGVSGDTTSGGRSRAAWSVGSDADAVILELGANDMLRGLPPKIARDNLDAIMAGFAARSLPVLLAGMRAAPNLGPVYGTEFNAIYPDLAEKHQAILYPFFLNGVAGNARLNQPDGIHPTAEGVAVIVRGILPSVEALIGRIAVRD